LNNYNIHLVDLIRMKLYLGKFVIVPINNTLSDTDWDQLDNVIVSAQRVPDLMWLRN